MDACICCACYWIFEVEIKWVSVVDLRLWGMKDCPFFCWLGVSEGSKGWDKEEKKERQAKRRRDCLQPTSDCIISLSRHTTSFFFFWEMSQTKRFLVPHFLSHWSMAFWNCRCPLNVHTWHNSKARYKMEQSRSTAETNSPAVPKKDLVGLLEWTVPLCIIPIHTSIHHATVNTQCVCVCVCMQGLTSWGPKLQILVTLKILLRPSPPPNPTWEMVHVWPLEPQCPPPLNHMRKRERN